MKPAESRDPSPEIVFRNVAFSYGSGRPPAVEDVSFTIARGASVGVFGASGSGKSTLLRLLVRWHHPTAGTILLKGVNLRDYSIAALRSVTSFVPRFPLLFSATLGDNIAYSRLRVSAEQIEAAAKAVNIHHLIVRNPRGYAVEVGDRGCLLTGTQRQLVVLAREYLRDPQVLVLDDPMAMVADGIESDVLRAIRQLSRGRTTVLASQDLSTLTHCDLILRIEQGRLVSVNADVAAACVSRSRGRSIDPVDAESLRQLSRRCATAEEEERVAALPGMLPGP